LQPPGVLPLEDDLSGSGEPPERRRGRLVPLLALVTALLLVTSVATGAMYTTTSSELERNREALAVSEGNAAAHTAVVSGKDKTIAELTADVDRVSAQLAATKRALDGTKDQLNGTKDQLNGTKDQLGTTKDQLGTTQSQLGTTQAQKAVVSRCLKLILQFFNAAAKGQNDKARKLYQQAAAPCEAADKIVN
jgi:septal ring factor EnvC (AmiA/AmiB activator)